ncbi:MAG: hypothetical protein K2N94_15385 [Lachnospiraceae bacterium]|nr:hypothetical protein [Lachnospiraceae bacterium]
MVFRFKRQTEAGPEPVSASTEEPAGAAGVDTASEANPRHTFRRAAAMLALCAMFFASAGAHAVLAADTSSTTSMIDMDMADQLIKLIKAANVLFTVFPINIFMIGSLVMLGLRVFRGAKKTATN